VNAAPALAPDAAIVLGIASTALPFASTPEDAAERWLRVLRMHGEAGAALRALGVSEGPLRMPEESEPRWASAPPDGDDRDAVAQVLEHAVRHAGRRGATGVATSDVLMAVMDVYGADFERVLRAHGADRDELIERLCAA
jgi:hypothetical protein